MLLAIYFAARIVMTFMGHGPITKVRNISIYANTNDKDLNTIKEKIRLAIGIAPGTDTHSKNLKLLNSRIEQIPEVRLSAVRRMPNGNMAVKIELYHAVAEWTDGTYYYPLSADGKRVETPHQDRSPNAVVFRGDVPTDISEITNAARNLIGDLEYIEWVDARRWNIGTPGGITVMLPEEDPTAAVASLVVLNKKNRILSKDIRVLDMRDPARILVK